MKYTVTFNNGLAFEYDGYDKAVKCLMRTISDRLAVSGTIKLTKNGKILIEHSKEWRIR